MVVVVVVVVVGDVVVTLWMWLWCVSGVVDVAELSERFFRDKLCFPNVSQSEIVYRR